MFVAVAEPAIRPEVSAAAHLPRGDGQGEASSGASRGRSLGRRIRRGCVPYLYIAPALVLLLIWIYRPLAQTFELSVYDWNLVPTSPRTYVGTENYTDLLTLPELWQALGNTGLYIAGGMLFSMVLPVLIALFARRVTGRARAIYQAVVFVPFLVTPVATGAVWRWLLAPEGGALTRAAGSAGVDLGNVFRDPDLALPAILLVVGWQMLGFGLLVVSTGLAGINSDYAAAASLDGAGPAMITRRITLPLLSPTLVFLALMTVLLAAQWSFPAIDLLTQGGPGDSSTNIYYLLYQSAFRNFDAGTSAAAGVVFFVAFGLLALVFVELSERLSFYDN